MGDYIGIILLVGFFVYIICWGFFQGKDRK